MLVRNFKLLNHLGKKLSADEVLPTIDCSVYQRGQVLFNNPLKSLQWNDWPAIHPLRKHELPPWSNLNVRTDLQQWLWIRDLRCIVAAYNIPRASTVTATAPIVSQMKKVCGNWLYLCSAECRANICLVDQRTRSSQRRSTCTKISIWFRQETRRTDRFDEEKQLCPSGLIFSLLAVREDAQHVSPAKPVASSRVSGAWKKVRSKCNEKCSLPSSSD